MITDRVVELVKAVQKDDLMTWMRGQEKVQFDKVIRGGTEDKFLDEKRAAMIMVGVDILTRKRWGARDRGVDGRMVHRDGHGLLESYAHRSRQPSRKAECRALTRLRWPFSMGACFSNVRRY